MEKSTWIPLAALIAAIIVPFSNSLFQDWLKKRSERIASANPALAQPNAITQAGSSPSGASRFITRRGRWFIISVQVLAGAIALLFIQANWPSRTVSNWLNITLAVILFISVQALPWLLKRFPKMPPAGPEPPPLRMFGLLWDREQNPLCPADQTLLGFFMRHANQHFDILQCPTCGNRFQIHDDALGNLQLLQARQRVFHRMQVIQGGRQ
jgi:hypothetical protein